MNTFFGLPAHPLLVHIPVVLVPLAALGTILIALRPTWRAKHGHLVLAVTGFAALGAILAAGAGDGLEERLIRSEGRGVAAQLHEHTAAGDLARLASIVFFIIVAVWLAAPWLLARLTARRDGGPRTVPAAARTAAAALSVVAALAATAAVVDAGHTGATSVWCSTDQSSC